MKIQKKIILFMFVFLSFSLTVFGSDCQCDTTPTDDVVSWMYDNGLTIYSNKNDFQTDKKIKREEASKFITKFAQNILYQETQENMDCYGFDDILNKNTLKTYMIQSCELGYMKGYKNKFNPAGYLSNQEAIAIVIRSYEGLLEEPKSDRSQNYYNRASELGLLDGLSLSNKKDPITRLELAILLYKVGTELITLEDNSIYELGNGLSDALADGLNQLGDKLYDIFEFKINYNSGLNEDFINKAKTCSLASITQEIDFDMFGMNYYMKIYREIQGFDGNDCKIYTRLEDARIQYLSGRLLDQIENDEITLQEATQDLQDIQSEIQETIGKYGTCKYTTGSLVDQLQSELSGDMIITDADDSNCTGPLYDY